MRFTKTASEAAEEPGRAAGGDYIKYLRDGDTTFRILQEPDDWKYYWEHYNAGGFSYPCTGEDDCIGCNSGNDRESKASRRIAFNVLQGYNGADYVNVFKVASAVADKLQNRYDRLETITDRDYTITRYKTAGDRYDFDVEGGMKSEIDLSRYELKDIEAMVAQQWEDAWGNGSGKPQTAAGRPSEAQVARKVKQAVTAAPRRIKVVQEEPPFEEPEYQEADLRAMQYGTLVDLIEKDTGHAPPPELSTTKEVVDWLMNSQR